MQDTYWTKSGANGAFCLNLANCEFLSVSCLTLAQGSA